MEKLTSERIQIMKSELSISSNVEFGKLAGADKSVVSQWQNSKIKSIAPRYAFSLQRNTGYQAMWIMLGEGPKLDPLHIIDHNLATNCTPEIYKELLNMRNMLNIVIQNVTRPADKREGDLDDAGLMQRLTKVTKLK